LASADVGDGVGDAGVDPFDVAGFHFDVGRAFADDVVAEQEVGDGDDEMGVSVVVFGHGAGDLEFGFGDADAVFDEEDFLGAAVKDLEAAVVVPFGGRSGVGLVVLEELDGDDAERCGGEVAGEVSEAGVGGADFAVLQFEGDGGLAGDFVGDFGGAESDEDVVVAMAVQQGGGVGSDFYLEDADVLIL
jgi:hypothetical protein